MSDKIDITLFKPHRVLGLLQAKNAQCVIHKGVAEDLIKRGIAEITNESTESESGNEEIQIDCGE